MARITVDFEHLMTLLLPQSLAAVDPDAAVEVLPSIDVDSIDQVPLLLQAGTNGHMIRNGYPGAGWEWTLLLTLLAGSLEQGGDLADTVYQAVHGMEGLYIPEVGGVASVDDVSMFDRVGTASLPDKQIVQYNATFTVRVLK